MSNKAAWIVIGIIAIIVIILLIRECSGPKVVVEKPVDSVFYWRDKYNNEVASLKGLEAQFGYREKALLDSIAKIHGVKPDRIKEYITVYQQGKTEIITKEKPVITYVDSGKGSEIKNVFQMFENPYYIAEATIDLSGKDSSKLLLETIDTLSVVWKEVREGGLFNKKRFLQLDVTNKNPYNRITGLQAYRVPMGKPKRFGVGLTVGYGFSDGLSPRVFIGPSIQYSVFRF